MRFTLRQLEVFLAVARSESVSRAARQLAMSQSAVSGALADLEAQFDILLFDRVGKRLQLNALGHALRARAEALLEQAKDLERSFANHADAEVLRVGATLTIGNHLVVPLMARFMNEHPGAMVTLEVANTAEIARKVANFEIDIGLIEGDTHHPELEIQPWRGDALAVFCAPTHPFARKRSLSDDELRCASWILREKGSGTRQTFEQAMHNLLPQLQVGLELQHTEAIKGAVEAGLGVGCVSEIALQEAFRHKELVRCKVPHRDLRRQFYFALHKRKFRTRGMNQWLELCRSAVA